MTLAEMSRAEKVYRQLDTVPLRDLDLETPEDPAALLDLSFKDLDLRLSLLDPDPVRSHADPVEVILSLGFSLLRRLD